MTSSEAEVFPMLRLRMRDTIETDTPAAWATSLSFAFSRFQFRHGVHLFSF
jgi:hypothetical protein